MDNQENTNVQQAATQETPGSKFGWAVLGFFIPLVGLILFIVWRTEKPRSAKASGIGAIVGFVLSIIFSIIYSVVIAGAMMAAAPY